VERTSTDPEDVAGALSRLVATYEPGASYEPIQMGDFYGARLRRLATMRLRVVRTHVKFKTGPAGAAETKRRVASRLRERGRPGDRRAADVIEAALGD
jgi:predicted FMN-binding regulatory protein PaiB